MNKLLFVFLVVPLCGTAMAQSALREYIYLGDIPVAVIQ